MTRIITELLIESLAYGGQGLGYHEGKVVFVAGTVPGDRIRCRVSREKKRYAEGVLEKIILPSSLRCEPVCPVFGECGGCQWQFMSYRNQVEWKETIFRSILQKQAKLDPQLIRPLAAAPAEWGYRSRAQIKVRQSVDSLAMGFYRRGTHHIADVESCPILHSRLNNAWALFRRWLPLSPGPGHVQQLDLETDDDGRTRAVVHHTDTQDKRLREYFAPLAEEAGLSLLLKSSRKDSFVAVNGNRELTIQVDEPPLRLKYGPGGFAQVNLDQNRAMMREISTLFPADCNWRVLDLFCGMGNFSLPLARRTGWVTGVEDFSPAIVQARRNAADNLIRNVEFHALSAIGAASRFSSEGSFDLVLLDPPRSGAFEVVRELAALRPQRILYVSCDPPTLARDLVALLDGGYRVAWSRPIDLFPQTHHTESITLLTL